MKVAKIFVLLAVVGLLTGGAALAESQAPLDLIVKIKPGGTIEVENSVSEFKINPKPSGLSSSWNETPPAVPEDVQKEMDARSLKMRDAAIIVISNPCAWVYANGRWYWRCW